MKRAIRDGSYWLNLVAESVAVACFVGMLGATVSFKKRRDAVLLEDVTRRLGRGPALAGALVRFVAVVVFLGPVIYFSLFSLRGEFGAGFMGRQAALTADTIGISMVWITLAVPLAAAIILVHLAARLCEPGAAEPVEWD